MERVGEPIAASGSWVDMFLLSYSSVGLEAGQTFLSRQLAIRTDLGESVEFFNCEDGSHFLIRLTRRILIKGTGYFDFRGLSPTVRIVKTESDWEQIKLVLKTRTVDYVPEKEEEEIPLWEYDFTNYVPPDVDVTERAREIMKLIEAYDKPPPKPFDVVVVKPPPRVRTTRPRKVTFVDKK
jgi:hypothetical protein